MLAHNGVRFTHGLFTFHNDTSGAASILAQYQDALVVDENKFTQC